MIPKTDLVTLTPRYRLLCKYSDVAKSTQQTQGGATGVEEMKLGSFCQLQSPLALISYFAQLAGSIWVRSANCNY